MTLNSVAMNMARVFGAAVGGVLTAIGLALCFALNAVSFVAVLLSLALMSTAALYPARPVRSSGARSGPACGMSGPSPSCWSRSS